MSESEQFRHPIPTENIWKKILLIAVCAKRQGLIANLSRIICIGEISSELKRKTEAAAFVFARLLAETKPDRTGAELYKIAADAYCRKRFCQRNKSASSGRRNRLQNTRLGDSSEDRTKKFFDKQAFAWNPSITGTKTEETVLVSENKIEILTQTPDFPQISVEIDGREYISPDILSL